MSVEPHPGLVLAGRYRLERELGHGGMGSVWLAMHTTLHSRVAVKVLSTNVNVKDAESRFLFEARAAARLNNPHVVHLSDFGVQEGRPFLVMELLEGETLAARLAREGQLSPVMTARILAQVCRGVSTAHDAGIVHRDLKPENVFLIDSGHELLVKVLDFGVAKALQAGSAPTPTETGTTVGTIPYMAPEQIADSKRVGIAADVWSLGVIAFECLLGQRPFEGENIATLVYAICHREAPVPSTVGAVPDGFDAWFARATAAEPGQRWASVSDAAAELSRLCGMPASSAAPAPKTLPTRDASAPEAVAANTGSPVVSQPSRPPVSRWPLLAAVVGVVVLGGAVWLSLSAGSDGVPSNAVSSNAVSSNAVSPSEEPSNAVPAAGPSEVSAVPTSVESRALTTESSRKSVPVIELASERAELEVPPPPASGSAGETDVVAPLERATPTTSPEPGVSPKHAASLDSASGANLTAPLDSAPGAQPAAPGASPAPPPGKPVRSAPPARRAPAADIAKPPINRVSKPPQNDEPPLFL